MAPPRISLVVPSLNQAGTLDACLSSILGQGYPDLECRVMDGGSSDGSVELIRARQRELAGWESGPDGGQFRAVARGLSLSTGEVMGWLNSDDMLWPGSLAVVGEVFAAFPEVEWITSGLPLRYDERGRARVSTVVRGFSLESFADRRHLEGHPGYLWWVQQESTFWRRSLWERAGGRLEGTLRFAGDFELWSRYIRLAPLHTVMAPLGGFRRHRGQKTSSMAGYYREAEPIQRALTALRPPGPRARLGELLGSRRSRVVRRLFQPPAVYTFPVILPRFDGRSLRWERGEETLARR
jgi:glycosyltransferase involved in cell wall biosynthesis